MSDPFLNNGPTSVPAYLQAGVSSPYQAEDLASFAGLAAGAPVITRDAYVRKDRTGQEVPGDAEAFARYDLNHDGVLTQAEWLLGRLADRDFANEATPADIAPIPLPDDPGALMQNVPGNWTAPSGPNNMAFTTVSPIGMYFVQPPANQALPASLPQPNNPQGLPQPVGPNPVGEASPIGSLIASTNGAPMSGATAAPIGPYITSPTAQQAPVGPLPQPLPPLGTPSALGPINVAPAALTLGNAPGSTAAPLGTFPLAPRPVLPQPLQQTPMSLPGLPAPLPLPPLPVLPPPLPPPPPPMAQLPPLPTMPLAPPAYAALQPQVFVPQPAQQFGQPPLDPLAQSILALGQIIARGQHGNP